MEIFNKKNIYIFIFIQYAKIEKNYLIDLQKKKINMKTIQPSLLPHVYKNNNIKLIEQEINKLKTYASSSDIEKQPSLINETIINISKLVENLKEDEANSVRKNAYYYTSHYRAEIEILRIEINNIHINLNNQNDIISDLYAQIDQLTQNNIDKDIKYNKLEADHEKLKVEFNDYKIAQNITYDNLETKFNRLEFLTKNVKKIN